MYPKILEPLKKDPWKCKEYDWFYQWLDVEKNENLLMIATFLWFDRELITYV